MSIPIKHHYLPQFFMQPWTADDGKVFEYTRPHIELVERRTTPLWTGYAKHLYTNESKVDPAERQALESEFMSRVDNSASKAHQHLLLRSKDEMDASLITDWARFLMSLLHRSPERVAYFNEKIATLTKGDNIGLTRDVHAQYRRPDDPETVNEWLNLQGDRGPDLRDIIIARSIDSSRLGNVLVKMKWDLLRLKTPRFSFLTGDLPLIIGDGLGHEKSFLLLAISPTDLFIAAARNETIEAIRYQTQKALVTGYNNACVRQSRHIIIAADNTQITFISKRFLKSSLELSKNGLARWSSPVLGW